MWYRGIYLFESDIDLNSLNRMSNAISSRGPDASGIWYDSNQRIAFAHRRLSILIYRVLVLSL